MEMLLSVIAGLLINGIAYLTLKFKIRTDVVVVLVAVLLGFGYQGFNVLLPPDAREFVVDFVSKAMAFSWIVWQFLIRPSINKSN